MREAFKNAASDSSPMDPGSLEFQVSYFLTIAIIGLKASLVAYLAGKLRFGGRSGDSEAGEEERAAKSEMTRQFTVGLFVVLVALLVSRVLSFAFDYYLTQFDTSKYLEPTNLVVWRVANVISISGTGYFLLMVDRVVTRFKFKGVPAGIVFFVAALHAAYPVGDLGDFKFISDVGIVAGVVILAIPVMFFWLACKSTGSVRRVAAVLGVGVLAFGVGGSLLSETFMGLAEHLFGPGARTGMVVASAGLRAGGLVSLAWGATRVNL
ncbi:MAG: hypothetical protein Kow0069_07910 [Promethearchaeota archaeon]